MRPAAHRTPNSLKASTRRRAVPGCSLSPPQRALSSASSSATYLCIKCAFCSSDLFRSILVSGFCPLLRYKGGLSPVPETTSKSAASSNQVPPFALPAAATSQRQLVKKSRRSCPCFAPPGNSRRIPCRTSSSATPRKQTVGASRVLAHGGCEGGRGAGAGAAWLPLCSSVSRAYPASKM